MDTLYEHCTITATLRRFSSCDGEDSESPEYDYDGGDFFFETTIYANGNCTENEGHVSIIFDLESLESYLLRCSFTCVASAIDASGNKRFPQSLALDNLSTGEILTYTTSFGFPKFLKRSTLLGDSSELLPDDRLTLCLEIDFKPLNFWLSIDESSFVQKNGCWNLRMDTEFGRELCKMSTVFRDMMECTKVEGGPDLIPISREEYRNFVFIQEFLSAFPLEGTLYNICSVYLTADKYDMQPVVQLCHQLLVSVLRAMNTREIMEYVDKDIHWISELAERFEDDENLREILAIYTDIKNKNEGRSGELYVSSSSNLDTGWNCKYRRSGLYSIEDFEFRKEKSRLLEIGIYK